MSKQRPYWWFDVETVDALRAQLDASPVGGTRLKVQVDPQKSMTMTLFPSGNLAAATEAPLNKSFLCPPICP